MTSLFFRRKDLYSPKASLLSVWLSDLSGYRKESEEIQIFVFFLFSGAH